MKDHQKWVVITQSNYIPWKGYFDLIRAADHVILYDDMQYTRRDWRNRNQIKTKDGLIWLTVPVEVKGKYEQTIAETKVSDPTWYKKHLTTIYHAYKKAPYFEKFYPILEKAYLELDSVDQLSKINFKLIKTICEYLNIQTKIEFSMNYSLIEGKTERLVDLCEQLHATDYLSGPAARDYIQQDLFDQSKIELHYADYTNYPTYPQIHSDFVHGVSILDLLFHVEDARVYMKDLKSKSSSNF